MSDLNNRFEGYQTVTAEIVYQAPSQPGLLQTYVWHGLDRAPRYPILTNFLKFWQRELDGPLHSVRIASSGSTAPSEVEFVDHESTVH